MKPDKYTKVVMTVIAVCLVLIVVKQYFSVPHVYAGEPGYPGFTENMKVGLVPVNDDGSISVRLEPASELDVNIVGIRTNDELEVEVVDFSSYDPVDVNLKKIGSSSISSGGPIPVEIEE